MERFAVFGFPILHSLSPLIHETFAKNLGIQLTYERIATPLGQLSEQLALFKAQGGKGANITLPLKMEAFQLCDRLSSHAKQAKAVNTIGWDKKELWGDNTDGEGLIRDLTLNLGLELTNKRFLILGAGGAARGILFPLLHFAAHIVIVNRDLTKAKSLAAGSLKLSAYSYEMLDNTQLAPFDFVINATSTSLQQILPPLSERWIKETIVIDLSYQRQKPTYFMEWSDVKGAKASYDGLGMLVEQAALSFQRWHGVLPDTQSVIRALK